MKNDLLKNNKFDILTLCCVALFYVLNRISMYLWVKGVDCARYFKGAGYLFSIFGIISALCMLLVDFRSTKVIRPFVILAISVFVSIRVFTVEASGRQVGGYMKIIDKGCHDGNYYLITECDPSLQLLCDKTIYDSVEKQERFLIGYRVIGVDKKLSYLDTIDVKMDIQ